MTPSVWMEGRCGSVSSPGVTEVPVGCHETSEGTFAKNVHSIRALLRRQGWTVSEGHWWCPVCTGDRRQIFDD